MEPETEDAFNAGFHSGFDKGKKSRRTIHMVIGAAAGAVVTFAGLVVASMVDEKRKDRYPFSQDD